MLLGVDRYASPPRIQSKQGGITEAKKSASCHPYTITYAPMPCSERRRGFPANANDSVDIE